MSNSQGYLYILYNESFSYYGDDVYKIGWSIDPKNRINGYRTSFVGTCKFLYISQPFSDGYKAERLLFYLLRRERLKKNREFFCISLDRCIAIIKRLEYLEVTPCVTKSNLFFTNQNQNQNQNKKEKQKSKLDQCYQYMCLKLIPYCVEVALKDGKEVPKFTVKNKKKQDRKEENEKDEMFEQFKTLKFDDDDEVEVDNNNSKLTNLTNQSNLQELETIHKLPLQVFVETLGFDAFLEQFRYRPSDPSKVPGYIYPEQHDVNQLCHEIIHSYYPCKIEEDED